MILQSKLFSHTQFAAEETPNSFFAKFEEAYAAIKDADNMINAMLEANENANRMTAMWKQAGDELMSNEACLTEEIKQLKSSIISRDEEKEVLQDEIQFSLGEKANTLYLFEECFLSMQSSVGELFEMARTDTMEVVKELHTSFGSFRSSLEDLICKVMQNDISIFVLQCQMGEYSHKVRRLNTIPNSNRTTLHEHCLAADNLELSYVSRDDNSALRPVNRESEGYQIASLSRKEIQESDLVDGDTVEKSSELKRELERRDVLLKGLLFDFSLLQEFASHRKDIKDELQKLIVAMSQVQHELQIKNFQLDDTLIQNTELEGRLGEAELALFNSNSELNQTKEALIILSEQNIELKDLLKDLHLKNSDAEKLLEDQREVIKSLEREIIRDDSLPDKQLLHSVEEIEEALTEATAERGELVEKLTSLQYKLDMLSALADENQAIAAEARQVN